jgi:hypothetical protein
MTKKKSVISPSLIQCFSDRDISTLPRLIPAWISYRARNIGFTMALFIADLAFGAELLNTVKLGVLGASVVSASLGLLMLAWLTSRR